MTQTTKDDFVRLLARARTALGDEGGTDPALLSDLAEAERLLDAHPVPWTTDIHTAFIEHSEGGNLYARHQHEMLMAEIAEFCREWWSEISDPRAPATLTDEEVVTAYFEKHAGENLSTERITLEGPDSALAAGLRIRRYLVIGIEHIRPTTADILDQWAPMLPEHRPLGVAETGYGWFVLTDPLDDDALALIPDELVTAIRFAHAQGCRYLLLDRDGDLIDHLDTFDW